MDASKCTTQAWKAVEEALALARRNNHIELSPYHLAAVLFGGDEIGELGRRICDKAGADIKIISSGLNELLRTIPSQDPPPHSLPPSRLLLKVFDAADALHKKQKDALIAIDHLILALAENSKVMDKLSGGGLSKVKLEDIIKSVRGNRKITGKAAESTYDALSKYAQDLVAKAEEGKLDPVIGRDEEVRRVIQVLSRRTKNNPVLIGEPGVGKTAIVEGLAQRILSGDIPENLQCRVFALDMGALIAGASFRGEFEERLKAVIKEVEDSHGKIILFIDEIHLVLGAGQTSGSMDAANLLKPALARGTLRTIGATTLDEYRKYVEKDPAFERRFQPVQVREPSIPDAVSILRGLKERYEAHHGVRIMDAALVQAVRLSARYITHRFLPDKAIDLVDEACASTRVQLDSQPEVIDSLERRKLQLEVEATALAAEKDAASKQRLQAVREELAKLEEQLKPLRLQYEAERKRVEEVRVYKQKLENVLAKIAKAERERDLATAADLKFGAVPELESKIERMTKELEDEKNSNTLLKEVVGPDQIAEVVARWTGIPVNRLTQSDRERLLQLGDRLHERVIGQDEAVEAVVEAVLRSRAGLAKEGKPTGSFLFLGPTGVGKTELAKALAEQLFDDEKHMVRLDMSEYMEEHSVSRLIGAPPGYVGHDEGGQLTEAVRRNPYSVVLFDEVEKAHQRIWNVLLQVLDDGRLTDGSGRTVDFSNTVIIMTSNLGAEFLLEGIDQKTGELDPSVSQKVMAMVKKHFRPEFLNRLDDIVIFKPLVLRQLSRIVHVQLNDLAKRLADRDILLDMNDQAAEYVLKVAYQPQYGARPLRRYLEKNVVTALSKMVIQGQLPNNTIVHIGLKDDKLDYYVTARSPRPDRTHTPDQEFPAPQSLKRRRTANRDSDAMHVEQ